MRKAFSLLSLAALTVGLLGSCSKINERIDGLEKRVDGIENEQITSINTQVEKINSSIADLGTIRENISSLKTTTEAQAREIAERKKAEEALGGRVDELEEQAETLDNQVEDLKEADIALGQRIDDLRTFVDDTLGAYATTEWVKATFSTLEQYEATCDTIAKIDARIGALDTKLSKDIQDCADSLKVWVNKQFEGYYTAAEMDAALEMMQADIDSAKAAGKITDERVDSLANELTKTKAAIETAKEAIRTEYRAAITSAITQSEGRMTAAISSAIADVNSKITPLTNDVADLKNKVGVLTASVSKLLAMIQSVSITPAYSDGSVEAVDGILTLKCIVSPAEALIGMESLKDSLLIYADSVKVKTKATTPAYMTIEVSEASVLDAAQGAITLKADISEYLPKGEDKALTVALHIKNGISNFTTEFVPVYVAPKTFKAVYNTNGDANTLTFYYDAVDHSGTGITVYEDSTTNYLFDNSKSYGVKWGYNGNRSGITSVVIDASVAGYKGLTSTAFMFQGMTKATGISGAEYLDVSNVTDMTGMFFSFGSSQQGFNSVPDVSGWKTGSVTNMASMFNSYGNNSTVLADVPDVSNWNTDNVTDMSSMFLSYGFKSKELNAVPEVGGWNTAKVENMNAMFKCFADSSTVLAVVPDVSNWDTGKVKNMGDMFIDYGCKSTELNTVPDVSGWNTIEVTSMTNMFQNYGYSSTALSTVPNVSNWNTGKVTRMANMFNGYGNTSTNISCVLDLSGWDLSKITSGGDVFKFNPKTFNVTIPAKTDGKSNDTGNWYYGQGGNGGNITPPKGKTFTLEYVEIGGVKWATKNLGAEKETDYGYYFAWGATELAYSSLSSEIFTFVDSRPASYGGSGWTKKDGFDKVNTPYYNGSAYVKYTGASGDGKTVLESGDDAATALLGSGWRMPTSAEFKALYDACLNDSYDTSTNPSGASASVGKGVYWCTSYDGVAGCLFCDGTNKLFFPAAGNGFGTLLINAGSNGNYWSSSLSTSNTDDAYNLHFDSDFVHPQHRSIRRDGFSVRPVSD